MLSFVAVFVLSFAVAFLITPVVRRLGERLDIVAVPGGRRQHPGPVSKLGGVVLFTAFLAGVGLTYLLFPPSGDDAVRLRGVVLGSLVIFLGGLLDDRFDLPPAVQFLIQCLGAAIAMSHIIFIEVFTNPLPTADFWSAPFWSDLFRLEGNLIWIWRPAALFVTTLWMVGFINTVNWLDGLDGLAAGVGTIAAVLFAWHSYRLDLAGQEAVVAFPLALAGALLGFLPFNFTPARIFLGTAGAYFLGYNLATMAILSPAKIATALLVLAIPILDSLWRVIDRLRQGYSPFRGDRGHLHFLLADAGWPTNAIVLGYYGLTLLFGLVAIFATGLMKLVILIGLGVGVLGLFVRISGRKSKY
jgi:UDP-GlcNAc:undecaprenyl-phosphate GlcNAc-1-phosphate transferase